MSGNDVLFGEGQDDDIIGGYGNDWISGGTGRDGVLGDDGRIYNSRNSETYGETLYGITPLLASDPETRSNNGNALNEVIYTPGKIQQSTINVAGELKKTVNLTPFKLGDPDALDYPTRSLSRRWARSPESGTREHPGLALDRRAICTLGRGRSGAADGG